MKFLHHFYRLAHSGLGKTKLAVLSLRLKAFHCHRRSVSIHHEAGLHRNQFMVQKCSNGKLEVRVDQELLRNDLKAFTNFWRRGGVFIDILSSDRIGPRSFRCSIEDVCSGRSLGFCSNDPQTVLVPDRGFYSSGGYRKYRQLGQQSPAWEARSREIVWRGNVTGNGCAATAEMDERDERLIQRVRLCLLARGLPHTDMKMLVAAHYPPYVTEAYDRTGIRGRPIDQDSWSGRKFAIDVDGNGNAFANFYIRMLLGCCVIKVASASKFRQWYYEDLQPWVHYVPVAPDLADLADVVTWCHKNDDRCQQIAANAQAFALSRTVSSERTTTIERICRAFSDDPNSTQRHQVN